jgi:hypothetical protein
MAHQQATSFEDDSNWIGHHMVSRSHKGDNHKTPHTNRHFLAQP